MTDPQKDQPGQPPAEDLESQLDDLLEEIDKAESAGVPPGEQAANAAAPAKESPPIAAPASAEPAMEDVEGGDLAAQIQQLLDDARQQPDQSTQPEPAAAAPPKAAPARMPEPMPTSTPVPAEPANLEQVDQMLANEADEAVAGDFETLNEVLAKETDGDKSAAAPPSAASAAPPLAEHAEPAKAQEDNADAVAGDFESPQELLEGKAASAPPAAAADVGFNATAQSVARELDEQPERADRPAPRSRKPEPAARAKRPRTGILALIRHLLAAQLAQFPNGLRGLCSLLSKPLDSASPQVRDTVGYIGLISLFWGSITVAGKVLSALFMAH